MACGAARAAEDLRRLRAQTSSTLSRSEHSLVGKLARGDGWTAESSAVGCSHVPNAPLRRHVSQGLRPWRHEGAAHTNVKVSLKPETRKTENAVKRFRAPAAT